MKKYLILGLVLGCFIFGSNAYSGPELSPTIKKLVSEGSCKGKKNCILAYVAPWCQFCHQAEPILHYWQTRTSTDPDAGIVIVVGKGDIQKNENKTYAQKFGSSALIDGDHSIDKAMDEKGFPKVFLIENGEITRRGLQNVREWAIAKYKPVKKTSP